MLRTKPILMPAPQRLPTHIAPDGLTAAGLPSDRIGP
jgi:hypothetical protein